MKSSKPPAYGQMNALIAIAASLRIFGHSPTIREIRDAVRVSSTNIVAEHVDRLEAKGWITREPKKHRGIRLTDKAKWFFGMDGRTPGRWVKTRPPMGDGNHYKVIEQFGEDRLFGFVWNQKGSIPEDFVDVILWWSSPEPEPPIPKGTK